MQRRHLMAAAALGPLLGHASSSTAAPAPGTVRTRVETSLGAFAIEVNPAVAPLSVANYLQYVDRHLLDGGAVYRVVRPDNQPQSPVKIEVVQWGMNLPDEQAPPLPAVPHETTQATGLRHRDGTVSMARNQPGSATSEFFICIGDQPELDFGGRRNPDGQGFAAFGQVVEGMGVVRALQRLKDEGQYLKPPVGVKTVRRV